MSDQPCPCSSACDPKDYVGRKMLYPDEGWHNWFLSTPENKVKTSTEWKPKDPMETSSGNDGVSE